MDSKILEYQGEEVSPEDIANHIEFYLNTCPLCGRNPKLVSYNTGSHADPNYEPYYRFVCHHGSHSNIPSCKTHISHSIQKCREEWNKGEDLNNYFPRKCRIRIDQTISHEKFVEFLGGEQSGPGC